MILYCGDFKIYPHGNHVGVGIFPTQVAKWTVRLGAFASRPDAMSTESRYHVIGKIGEGRSHAQFLIRVAGARPRVRMSSHKWPHGRSRMWRTGTYGTVLKAIDLQSKCTVALKKMRIDLDEEGIPPTALRECAVLKALSHPNVIKLHDVVHRPHSLYLVFECADTDLKQHMDSQICALPLATVRVRRRHC